MVRTLVSTLLLAALSLVGVAGVSAQTGPTASGELTDEAVVAYLRSLDPNLEVEPRGPNCNRYQATIVRDGWSYRIKVEVHRGYLYLLCHLGKPISPAQALPANQLLELLRVNDGMGGTYFS
jgi:hypothetical protein